MLQFLNDDWKKDLKEEFIKPYFKKLQQTVKEEYSNYTCYPEKEAIYNALNTCSLYQVKVVIIGQDPYPNTNQANGLCFSVNKGVTIPPSLQNIFKELQNDIGKALPNHGDLTYWAQQGVLLLNTILTVREKKAGSHKKIGWETFTDAIIKKINMQNNPVIFLLWGGYAKRKQQLITNAKHTILTSGHPSPLSANRGLWFGNKHFSKTNFLLEQAGFQKIQW